MALPQKESIFTKAVKLGESFLDGQIMKARNRLSDDGSNFVIGKAVTQEKTYSIGSQGYYDKMSSIGYEFQRHMALRSSIIAAIITTRQTKVAGFAQPVKDESSHGFRIVLKDRDAELRALREELFPEGASEEQSEQDIKREVSEELDKRTRDEKARIEKFLENCGETENRPFDSKRWNFESFLKAVIWDSLVFDQLCFERIPKKASVLKNRINIHHFTPVDGSTIRYASPELGKVQDSQYGQYDILYPEQELEKLQERDTFELDEEKLEKDEYKFVQVVRGKIERAFTEIELCMAMRNPTTDIYRNGYSVSELELLVSLVSSHLHTENYNRLYFQQGFSAKGILHVKANLNRSKLEELRRHWHHMVKGGRNSFQTPIMAGMDEVQWIPLTQNHSEMEFSLWLNYLIKMICAIYRIDPAEIGYGMKEEGGKGGGLNGDNTSEKLETSKDKGFVPLMTFLANVINREIVDHLNPKFKLEWIGLIQEDPKEVLEKQEKEVKFKKTVNEVREESGLPPIPGADHLILDPTYMTWFSQFSDEGRKLNEENQKAQMEMEQSYGQGEEGQGEGEGELDPEQQAEMEEEAKQADHEREKELISHKLKEEKKYKGAEKGKVQKSLPNAKKPIKIEYYKI